MDFISGASMVASREFYETAGPIPEDYFLYYEEIDWALRRKNLPLLYCPDALVFHHAGTSIGSPRVGQIASPFSFFFKHRSRMRFMLRFFPAALLYSVAKAGQLLMKGHSAEAGALLRGSFSLPPAQQVRDKLSPEARRVALKR
jgi:GT2 family glycosyltransferase